MTIKQLFPRMLLVAGLVLTILVSAPSRVLSTDPEKSKAQPPIQTDSAWITDDHGKVIGTSITTKKGGVTTITDTINSGPNAGQTKTYKLDGNGNQLSATIKNADGSGLTSVRDDKGGNILTTTDKAGGVEIQKRDASGTLVSRTLQSTDSAGTLTSVSLDPKTGVRTVQTNEHKNGTVDTITFDAGGMPAVLSVKDKNGNVTTALPDGKGGFTSTVKDGNGNAATTTYDPTGKPTLSTVKDKNGIPISTATYTPDGKGGYTQTTTDLKTGSVTTKKDDGSSTVTDKNGKVISTTTVTPDAKGGSTTVIKGPDGKVETTTRDASGKPTGLTITDSKGNVTTALPDGKGGFTSAVTDKHGQVATSSYDADGKLTGETTRDKKGHVISTTTTTYDGTGGSTSVTKDKNGKVVSTTTTGPDGNVVSQTGKKQIMTLGAGGQPTGGTQTSQGSGKQKDKHKFETEVFHPNKDKSNVQDSGSSGASSGSGQQMHHKKH
jgi:YD repeat-containing protein